MRVVLASLGAEAVTDECRFDEGGALFDAQVRLSHAAWVSGRHA